MLNWDDLRVFAVTARCGSLAAAATQLGMDPSTVGRRVTRLESHLKSALLVRTSNGLQLTASGVDLQQVAQRVETAMEPTNRSKGAGPISGVMRISLPEAFGGGAFMAEMLASASRFKDLSLEFSINRGEVQVGRGEVDIALTVRPPKLHGVVVEEIGRFESGLFASRDYLDDRPAVSGAADLVAQRFIRLLGAELNGGDGLLGDVCARMKACMTSASLSMHLQLLESGAGFGLLPCFLGEAAGLRQVLPGELTATRSIWLSTDRDLAGAARTRTVRAWLVGAVQAQIGLQTAEDSAPADASVLAFTAPSGPALPSAGLNDEPRRLRRPPARILAAG